MSLTELRVVDGVVRLSPHGDWSSGLAFHALARVLRTDGSSFGVPIEHADPLGSDLVATGAALGFEIEARWSPRGRVVGYHEVKMAVRYVGREPIDAALRIEAFVPGTARPNWLIPGLFYGENRRVDNRVVYPRWDPAGGSPEDLVSDAWSFRADRAAVPQVFCWRETACVALWGDDTGELGDYGLGFRGSGTGSELNATIWLDVPVREEPVAYVAADEARPPTAGYHRWQPGEVRSLRFGAYVADADRHAYDPFVREAYTVLAERNALRPWMSPGQAADLCAYGLLRWHYKAEHAALFETAAFDRAALGETGDRPNMHVAWVSGAPWAAALLEHGRRTRSEPETTAATSVLDKIASGLAPCGAFWGEWRLDRGWSAGWNEGGTLHARTLGEATLFMLRALAAEQERGNEHPAWAAAVRSNLEFAVSRQREDGNFGSYYVPTSGDVAGWEGAAGLGWLAALAEGAAHFGEAAWLAAAQKGGDYYARFVADELIYGAPEDVHLTPTSEDGYQAVMAYMALHTATHGEKWRDLAASAADWMLTFRYAYNVRFSPTTMLGEFDFRTRGGDQASPANQHLHAYGLIALPEMLALWRATGDDYYLARTRDNLSCFLQFIAREDSDFNAQRGMVSERFHQTEWGAPKGSILALSHAWSVGVVLYAAMAAQDSEAFPAGWPSEPAAAEPAP